MWSTYHSQALKFIKLIMYKNGQPVEVAFTMLFTADLWDQLSLALLFPNWVKKICMSVLFGIHSQIFFKHQTKASPTYKSVRWLCDKVKQYDLC